ADLDGDGVCDIVVGGERTEEVLVISGREKTVIRTWRGNVEPPTDSAPREPASSEHFGSALAILGDVDRDGFPDVAVGAFGADEGRGRVAVVSGATGERLWTRRGARAGDAFGFTVAGLGDRSAFGGPVLAVGAPGAEDQEGIAE